MYQVAWTNYKISPPLLLRTFTLVLWVQRLACISFYLHIITCVCCSGRWEFVFRVQSLELSVRKLMLMCERECNRETVDYCTCASVCVNLSD